MSNDGKCWYEILGLPQLADADAVKKAFRQMSLKHHPDKGGDVDKFHELQQASQYLSDPTKKKDYDAKISQITMQDKQRKERASQMSAERKRMAEELLRREGQIPTQEPEAKRPKHVMRDFKAKARQHMEEMQAKKAQESRERAGSDIKQRTIRVSWNNNKESHSDQTLVNAFREYGEIETVKMKSNSARIVFADAAAATQAARIEGHNTAKWKDVTLVGHVVHTSSHTPHGSPEPQEDNTPQLQLHPVSISELSRFESIVFSHLKKLSKER
ncbi:Aste57867_6821 [Aphanomyces stellatus]|uniref:Aste57867_6821 protein n=1 Tax=Aphanomyces stellatus TaxID=120398 RepID=A0A485KHQ5_9STRA|nr:hypothetical protein As57867_006801 [Aphanomyces stellatus]VFT83785.1 Aste57867_6821 [Aphanomyces stellatus]